MMTRTGGAAEAARSVTVLEQLEELDVGMCPSTHPGARLHTSYAGEHTIGIVDFPDVPHDSILAEHGIVRVARYAVLGEHDTGLIGEDDHGELYDLRRRGDTMQKTPATLSSPLLDGGV